MRACGQRHARAFVYLFVVGEFDFVSVARDSIICAFCEATELAVGSRESDRHMSRQTTNKDVKQVRENASTRRPSSPNADDDLQRRSDQCRVQGII